MPKAKPKWGFFCLPDARMDLVPSDEKVSELIEDLSELLDVDLRESNNEAFKHPENKLVTFRLFLEKLISDYRENVLYDHYYPTNASVKETLLYLQNIATELEKRFEPLSIDEGIDEETWWLLEDELPEGHEGLGKYYKEGIVLKKTIESALEKLSKKTQKTGRKAEFGHKVWLAKNVAVTFTQALNLKPTKTRNGKFDKAVGKILKACDLSDGDFKVVGYEAAQNFKVISAALDEVSAGDVRVDPWGVRAVHLFKHDDMPAPQYMVMKGEVYIDGKQVKK